MNDMSSKDDINTSSSPSRISKKSVLLFAVGISVVITASVVGYTSHIKAEHERAELAAEQERIAVEKEREAQLLLEKQKREAEKKEALARANEWLARTVQCPKCQKRFTPENNKAPLGAAVGAGVAAGAVTGGAAGTYVGAGTGVAVGGVGAFPGAIVGGVVGATGGGVVGGVSSAWYRDRQVMCPYCEEIFKNPKN